MRTIFIHKGFNDSVAGHVITVSVKSVTKMSGHVPKEYSELIFVYIVKISRRE